jgi:hypothetical protein
MPFKRERRFPQSLARTRPGAASANADEIGQAFTSVLKGMRDRLFSPARMKLFVDQPQPALVNVRVNLRR